MARARKRSRQVTLVEPSHSSDEDETDDDASSSRHASPRGGRRPVGGRDPTLARNGARGKYQGGSEPIWRAPGRRNDSHEGEYDGYDQGRTRVIQRRFNVSVPRARVPKKASTLRDRSER